MDYFMPSDIARIVLGYMKENSYMKTYVCFMKECSLLHEYYNLVKAGRQPQLTHPHLNLLVILDEWGRYKQTEEASRSRIEGNLVDSLEDSPDEQLIFDNDITKPSQNSPSKRNKSYTGKSPLKGGKNNTSQTAVQKSKISSVEKHENKYPNRRKSKESFESGNSSATKSDVRFTPTKKQLQYSPKKLSPEKFTPNKNCPISDSTSVPKVFYTKSPVKVNRTESQTGSDVINSNASTDVSESTKIFKNIVNDCDVNDKTTVERENETLENAFSKIGDTVKSGDNSQTSSVKCLQSDKQAVGESRTSNNGSVGKDIEKQGTAKHNIYISPADVRSRKKSGRDETIKGLLDAEPLAKCLVTPKKPDPHTSVAGVTFVTPVKLFQHEEHGATNKSPRRKKPKTPRKRASDVHVSPTGAAAAVVKHMEDPIFQQILCDTRLHEKLAETCNIVSGQIKLSHSGREEATKDVAKEMEQKQVPVQSMELETVIASRSLEEILDTDTNFTADILTEKLDMSDPVYESLFKLFSTDRAAFCESLRREKERSEAEMQAEIEDLERSIHELETANHANLAASQGDEGYETQGLGHNSPHYLNSQQDLFSSQAQDHSPLSAHTTSTPCGNNMPVNFTPMLRGQELGSSPLHSETVSRPVSSVTSQPFSPGLHQNTPIPGYGSQATSPQSVNTGYLSENPYSHSSPATPIAHNDHIGSAGPSTPLQLSSPASNQHLHSTPRGPSGVRTHIQQSPPINIHHNTISNNNVPSTCSPLVKADLHPGSPMMCQKGGNSQARKNIFQPQENGIRYYNSLQPINDNTTTNMATNDQCITDSGTLLSAITPDIPEEEATGYLHLLNDAIDQYNTGQLLQGESVDNMFTNNAACSTIENTIGCISLPTPEPTTFVARRHGQGKGKKGKKKGSKKAKQKEKFSTLKGLLGKEPPLLSQQFVPIPITPQKGNAHNQSITLMSPGGSKIDIPVLGCQDARLQLKDGDSDIAAKSTETVNLWSQNLDNSSEYTLLSDNTSKVLVTATINESNVNAQTEQLAVNASCQVVPIVQTVPISTGKTNGNNLTGGKKKGGRRQKIVTNKLVVNDSSSGEKVKSPLDRQDNTGNDNLLDLEPGDLYTATPIQQGSLLNRTHVRSLNFGAQADDPTIAHFRKICPKPQNIPQTPQIIIVHTNGAVPVPVNKETTDNLAQIQSIQTGETTEVHLNCSDNEETKEDDQEHWEEDSKSEIIGQEDLKSEDSVQSTPTKTCVSPSKSLRKTRFQVRNECDNHIVCETSNDMDPVVVLDVMNGKVTGKTVASKTKSLPEEICNAKKCKSKRVGEKLKVKISVGEKSKSRKKKDSDKSHSGAFPYRRKHQEYISTDESNSTDDIPLSELKDILCKKDNDETEEGDIRDEIDKENNKDRMKNEAFTPRKTVLELSTEEFTPSKEELLEKVGLTPTKSLLTEFRSPNRANALDILSEWQGSPLSSRKRLTQASHRRLRSGDIHLRSPTFQSPMKSPTAPKRLTPAKKLFTSPTKDIVQQVPGRAKSEHAAKRVNNMIEKLHKNNPECALIRPDSKHKKTGMKELNLNENFKKKGSKNKVQTKMENRKSVKYDSRKEAVKDKTGKETRYEDEFNSEEYAVHNVSNFVQEENQNKTSKEISLRDSREVSHENEQCEHDNVDSDKAASDAELENGGDIEREREELETSVNNLMDIMNNETTLCSTTETHGIARTAAVKNESFTSRMHDDECKNHFSVMVEVHAADDHSDINDIEGNIESELTELHHALEETETGVSYNDTVIENIRQNISQTEFTDSQVDSELAQSLNEGKLKAKKRKHKKKHRHSHGNEDNEHGSKHRSKHKHRDRSRVENSEQSQVIQNSSIENTDNSHSKRKSKHKHRHRDGEDKESREHRRKHKRRHRESEGEHRHEHSRKRKREETTGDIEGTGDNTVEKRQRLDGEPSLDNLAQLNIDEALSKLYK